MHAGNEYSILKSSKPGAGHW